MSVEQIIGVSSLKDVLEIVGLVVFGYGLNYIKIKRRNFKKLQDEKRKQWKEWLKDKVYNAWVHCCRVSSVQNPFEDEYADLLKKIKTSKIASILPKTYEIRLFGDAVDKYEMGDKTSDDECEKGVIEWFDQLYDQVPTPSLTIVARGDSEEEKYAENLTEKLVERISNRIKQWIGSNKPNRHIQVLLIGINEFDLIRRFVIKVVSSTGCYFDLYLDPGMYPQARNQQLNLLEYFADFDNRDHVMVRLTSSNFSKIMI